VIVSLRGSYRATFPDSWQVLDTSDRVASLVPIEDDGIAVTISVIRNDRSSNAGIREAPRALDRFVRSLEGRNVTPGGMTRVRSWRQNRCFAEISGAETRYFVGALGFGPRLVFASATAHPASRYFEEAVDAIASIAPWSRFG